MNISAFLHLRSLIAAYVVMCVIAVVGEVVATYGFGVDIGAPAWTRTSILVVVALVAALLTRSAGRGSARAFLRLRIVTAIQLVATVVIVALPAGFPSWLRVEQALCAIVLLGVVVVANGRGLRDAFRARTGVAG